MSRGVAAVALTLALALVLSARPALASAPVVVDTFTGAKKKAIRTELLEALDGAGIEVVEADEARVEGDSGESAYVSHASKHGARAFIDGDTALLKSGWVLKLTVRNGADGKVLGTTTLRSGTLPGLRKKIDAEAVKRVQPSLERARAPSAAEHEVAAAHEAVAEAPPAESLKEEPPAESAKEEPSEAKQEPDERRREPASERRTPRQSPLELSAGMGAFSRSFEYHQDVNGNLHPYHLPLAPVLAARARWYPGAHFTSGMGANIGIELEIERSVGASSVPGQSNRHYGTTMQELSAGPRFRLPISRHELGVSLSYGSHRFDIDSDHDPSGVAANGLAVNRDYVPDASYQYLRPGLDARFAFGPVQIGAGIGYRAVLGLGQLTAAPWFPHATARALDGFIMAAYELLPGLLVTAAASATRYALDMHTTLADRQAPRDLAGGAVDQYLAGRLGFEWRLPEPHSGSSGWNVSERARHIGSN